MNVKFNYFVVQNDFKCNIKVYECEDDDEESFLVRWEEYISFELNNKIEQAKKEDIKCKLEQNSQK